MNETKSYPTTRVPKTPYRRATPPDRSALRLDGNEGDMPPQLTLRSLAANSPGMLRDYPDLAELEGAVAARFGVNPECVVITAGADDAIDRVCRAFLEPGRELLVPTPTFEMIHRFAEMAGGTVATVPWKSSFPVNALASRLKTDTALVAIVSPNNPTGLTASLSDLEQIVSAASSSYILLDHAYVEYADTDLTAAALKHENVIVARTFSKAWGLAGCRVGYALASPEVANVIRNAGNPYPVSAPSIAVVLERLRLGQAALDWHVGRVRKERAQLRQFLDEHGVTSPRSEGNFVFAELGERTESTYVGLAEAGVLVRFFPHRPETRTGLRLSLPGEDHGFARLLRALGACLSEAQSSTTPSDNDSTMETLQ